MQPNYSQKGQSLLVAVTVAALALQALKLGSRGLVLQQWPTMHQWAQLGIVVWLLTSLWEGKEWARVASALYFSFAAALGAFALYLMGSRAETSLSVVSVVIVVLAGGVSATLWFSGTLRAYIAGRRSVT